MTVDDARQRALNWLKQGELSAAAIHQRLLSAGHDPSTCDTLINQLVANGTIDDARCAESLVRRWTHAGPIAPGELRRRLHEKGVPPDVAAQATELANGDDEITQAMEAAERKMKSLGGLDPLVVARRLFGHLARRGYDEETARAVLDRLGLAPADE